MMKQTDLQVTLIVFRIENNSLCIFMPNNHLPSERISESTSLDKQINELFQKNLGFPLGKNYCEQLYTFSKNNNLITIAYYVLLCECKKEKAPGKSWKNSFGKRFAEQEIIAYSLQRLRWKIEYTNVIYSLLPKTFTLSDLQKAYEIILGKQLDKRNFRKKILSLNFVKPTGEKRVISARPAQMYTFTRKKPQLVKVFS
jgi:8-oxo-dGTP diphosphatase